MSLRKATFALFVSLSLAACSRGPSAPPQNAASLRGASTSSGEAAKVAGAEDGAAEQAPTASAPASEGSGAPAGAGAAAAPRAARDEALSEPEEKSRPGLGTSWGESRSSRVSSTSFERDTPDSPFATAALYYNDEQGVAVMSRGRFVDWSDSVVPLGSGITVSIVDPGGRPLRAAHVDGRTIAVGHDGDRYVVRVDNHTPMRIEAVATVDGLDVIDGDDGSFSKRGYVIPANDTLEIEGFRDSEGSVRTFRFGATDDSYGSRRGKGRNVGVIGVALFRERGSDWRWTPEEVRTRNTADPFPGRFAPAPPPAQQRAR